MEIVFLSGLSGSGKTTALKAIEDSGFFCIDNLPLSLFKKLLDIIEISSNQLNRISIVCDVRDMNIGDNLRDIMEWLSKTRYKVTLVFLEADKRTLIRRFEQTRRTHPLSILEGLPLAKAIDMEIALLEKVRNMADVIIDTSNLNVNELRRMVISRFVEENNKKPIIQLISFGFKYGVPIESDNLWDVRFIPNPYFIEELRDTTGLDTKTFNFVISQSKTKAFLKHIMDFLREMIPLYSYEGKSYLTLSFGCTGGKHRSVAVVEYLKAILRKEGYKVEVLHRDIER